MEITLVDYGLADLEPGQRARMVYAAFTGCLSWPGEQEGNGDTELTFLPEEIESLGSCGLPLDRYIPSALFAPRMLGVDIDGDGAHDSIVPVRRGEQRGLAICRAGTRLTLLGFDVPGFDPGLEPGFLPALEAWRIVPHGTKNLGYIGEPAWPDADGDIVLLERIEKAAVLLFMQKGRFQARTIYRYIEP